MTAEPDLLPCPFCGPGESVVSLWFDDVSNRFRVGCGRCGCSTGTHPRDKTETPAIAAWNTRANVAHATAAKDAEIEALRAEVDRLHKPVILSDWQEMEARAERLAEALRGIEKELGSELVVVSGGRVYLPERAFRKALHDGRTALEQEAGRG